MTMTQKETRASYFADDVAECAFGESVTAFLAAVHKDIVSRYLSPENTHRIRHGGTWTHPGLPNAVDASIEQHSSVVEIPFEDLMKHDLSAIDRFAQKFAENMEQQFAQMMYASVIAACDQTGNTVDAKATGSTLDAFAEVLEKVQFSVDKFGKVTLPEIHGGPEAIASLKKGLAAAPPDFEQRIEDIKARKTAEALERESQRKARFVRYGGNG